MGKTRSLVYSILVVAAGACSDTSGCNTQPLPGGALPADQTIEGGAQIRVTRQGFQKLTAVVPGLINQQIGNGLCVPQGSTSGAGYCFQNDGQCTPGCKVDLQLNQTTFIATNPNTLSIRIALDLDTTVPIDPPSWCFGCSQCYIDAYTNPFFAGDDISGVADIEMVADASTGELDVRLARIRNVNLDGVTLNGRGGSFCDATAWFADFFKTYFAQQIVDYFTPRLNDMIRNYIPDPLGIEGIMDVGPLLAGISPGTKGTLEARIIPGGYVAIDPTAQGLSLGVITGINSDEDTSTRSASLDSEPALCVPPIGAPSFGGAPWSLPTTSRNTFAMAAAPAFSGSPDPNGSDLSVGISETSLDLIGHHAVASGVMCLGIGTTVVPQLNVGTFGILVPSVAELASEDGNDPLMVVTRPQKDIDFSIGDNTPQSPAITIHLRDFELDVYPFLYERYIRAFTMNATLDIGVNLEFEKPPNGPWRIKPTLVGLGANQVTVKVLNNDFLAESKSQLEGALPSVFDLLTSQLTIPPVDLPTFAGFEIVNPSIAKVTSPQDDFLALNASLNVTVMMRELAQNDRFMAAAVDQIERTIRPEQARAQGTARMHDVDVPKPEAIRAALAQTGGALPTVTIDVDRVDARGRELEWSWRIGNGMWRPYSSAAPLVIADRAFAWQGEYAIGLMTRVKGEPSTASDEQVLAVTIDSVGPHVVKDKTAWEDGDYQLRGWDVVSGRAIKIAFGRLGDDAPRTEWQTGGTAMLTRAAVDALAVDGELVVFLVDEQGNQTIATVAPFHGQAGQSGCNCDSGGSPAGTWSLALVVLLLLRRRRGILVRDANRRARRARRLRPDRV